MKNYALLARLTISAGTILILAQHWLGLFSGDPDNPIVFGAMMIGIGLFMIPGSGASHN